MAKKDFSSVPSVSFKRTKMDLGHTVKTSMNVGTLYPVDWQEVLPGDSFNTRVTNVSRVASSFIKPVMDNLKLEVAHFFVPYRLVFEDWEKVFGNANPSAYIDNDLAEVPMTNFLPGESYHAVLPGTVADYLGLPLGEYSTDISVLPFRAFALIYNTWFRNENSVNEVYINKGSTTENEFCNDFEWSETNYFGKLPKVRKKYDYFTSCLPAPQKGAGVGLPLVGSAPVRYLDVVSNQANPTNNYLTTSGGGVVFPTNGLIASSGLPVTISEAVPGSGVVTPYANATLGINFDDLTFATVNDLRFAFQAQKMLERDALGGSRYHEYLNAHFGVISPDSRFQLPEYLGGGIIPIGVQQVAQTSQTTVQSPLANVAGYSLTNGYSKYSKGFTEHGIVMTVAYIRQYEHSYSQGVEKKWFRKVRQDFYDPLFANLGEQPVYKKELYAGFDRSFNAGYTDQVFGYNEAWAEYRYSPNKITGQMRSDVSNSFDIWHFGDELSFQNPSEVVISQDFIEETPLNVDRTLSVSSRSANQFLCDFYFDTTAIRVMPLFSVPGLIDHH